MSKGLSETVSSAPVIAGRYTIGRILGQGGMGAVVAAEDKESDRAVAVKILLAPEHSSHELSDLACRLRDEAAACQAVKSEHLVEILDQGHDDVYGPFVVFEKLGGKTLRDELKNGPLPLAKARDRVIVPLLEGLAALHEGSFVHRDIKPENLLLASSGKFKIGDLGLAFFDAREAHTKTGCIVGTPGFVAPELLTGQADKPTARADVYGAAVLIVETLTGQLPFIGKNAAEILKEQLQRELSEDELQKLGVPKELCHPLHRSLRLEPKERYDSGAELLQALKECGLFGELTGQSNSQIRSTKIAKQQRANMTERADPKDSAARRARYGLAALLLILLLLLVTHFAFFQGSKEINLSQELKEAAQKITLDCHELKELQSFERQVASKFETLLAKVKRKKAIELWQKHFVSNLPRDSVFAQWANIWVQRHHGSRLAYRSGLQSLREKLSKELSSGSTKPAKLALLTYLLAQEWQAIPDRSLAHLLPWLDVQFEALNSFPLAIRRGIWADNHRYLIFVLRAASRYESGKSAGFEVLVTALLAIDKLLHLQPELIETFAPHLKKFRQHANEKGVHYSARSLRELRKVGDQALDLSAARRKKVPQLKLQSSIKEVNELVKGICLDARLSFWTFYASFVLQPGMLETRQGLTKAARNVADVMADPLITNACPQAWWGDDLTPKRAMFTCLATIRSLVDDCLRSHPSSKELCPWLTIEMVSRASRAYCDRSFIVWREGFPCLDKETQRLKKADTLIAHYLLKGHLLRARGNKRNATLAYGRAFREMEKVSDEMLLSMSKEEVANYLEVVKEIVDSSLMSKVGTNPVGKERARQARVLLEMLDKPLKYGRAGGKDRLFIVHAATVNRALGLYELGDVKGARKMADTLRQLSTEGRTKGVKRLALSTLKKLGIRDL